MTFVVTNNGDNGGVDPAPLAGTGTLRQAIVDANANGGPDVINFAIPGAPPFTIAPVAPLPAITGTVTIDGTTQPGFAGTPIVELSGLSAGAANGLNINTSNSIVRALVINRFGGHGISINGSSNVIEGNFIGTNTTGTFALANTLDGVFVSAGASNTIGGTTTAARNVLSGNRNGVQITGAGTGNQVRGNFIGTTASGTSALGNSANGVLINGSSGNSVGAVLSASANTIAFNGTAGVAVAALGTGNSILSNSIFLNGGLGIDLSPAGVTANDTGDPDGGANNLQNFPVLTSAISVGDTDIDGTLNSTASTTFRIEFYSNQVSDASGFGEGQTFIGSTSVTTDGSGNASFSVSFPITVPGGQVITATATNPGGDTSEFSRGIQVGSVAGGTPADLSVTTVITGSPETGSEVTKTIFVSNAGPATAVSVTVTDVLTSSLSFVSCTSTGGGVCGGSGNTRTITFASLPVGTNVATITIIARVNCSAAAGAPISNTASVFSASTPDNNPGNNMATATTVAINPGPRITCPANITAINDPGACFATVNFLIPVTDNCPLFNVVCNPASGSHFAIGTTPVTCVATDTGGATATCSFTVTVSDIERLGVSCPSNITVTASAGNCTPVVTFPTPTVIDNCPGATISCVPPSGSSFPLGVTNVLCTAVDAQGVQATCGFTVNVIGTPQAVVRLEGNAPFLDFGPVAASRKFKKVKKQPVRTFTVENIGCVPLVLTFDSLNRTGRDVERGFITNPDDRKLFNLTIVDAAGNETPFEILTDVRINPGQKQNFKIRFNPLIPAVAGTNRGLSADEVLPDLITSLLTFLQNGGAPLRIDLVGHLTTDVVLIEPDNPRQLPLVTFLRSGNEFIVEFSIFDSNLDVNRVVYQFFGKKQRPAADPITIDLRPVVQQANLVRGQSFTIIQRVSGAHDRPEIVGVSVTVSDPESSDSVNSVPVNGTSSQQILLRPDFRETRLFAPELILPGGKRRAH